MGNNYCCAYSDKPSEDILIESKQPLIIHPLKPFSENNINIGLKLGKFKNKGNNNDDGGRDSELAVIRIH